MDNIHLFEIDLNYHYQNIDIIDLLCIIMIIIIKVINTHVSNSLNSGL